MLSEKLLNWIAMRELATTETEREAKPVKPTVGEVVVDWLKG